MKVKFFADYRKLTHCNETDIPAPADVWALLTGLGERYGAGVQARLFTPDRESIGSDAIILVNGRNIQYLNGKDTPLAESDTVSVFPLVAGG